MNTIFDINFLNFIYKEIINMICSKKNKNYAIIYLRVECNKINYINLRKEDCRIICISL